MQEKFLFSNIDTTPASINAASLNERLDKQDEQLQSLKKENEVLKKQMKQIKTLFNANRRMIVFTDQKQTAYYRVIVTVIPD